MQTPKNHHYTYIQEAIDHTQQSYVEAHMDEIGMVPTEDPAVFKAPNFYHRIYIEADILSARNALPMHSHSAIEIIYYASGSNVQYLAGIKRYRLQKGDIVCTPPGINHRVLRPEAGAEPCRRYLLSFIPSFMLDLQGKEASSCFAGETDAFILHTTGTKWEPLEQLFENCVRENNERGLHWRQMLRHYAELIMIQLLRAQSEDTTPAPKAEQSGLFEELLAYVEANLDKQITLYETAKHFFVSQRTVTRIFQSNLDISFYRYVTLRRLDNARKLMLYELPMEEICTLVGFSDYPTFYRAFVKECGISPSQMKKVERNEMENGGACHP